MTETEDSPRFLIAERVPLLLTEYTIAYISITNELCVSRYLGILLVFLKKLFIKNKDFSK